MIRPSCRPTKTSSALHSNPPSSEPGSLVRIEHSSKPVTENKGERVAEVVCAEGMIWFLLVTRFVYRNS